ncbi:transcription initiation factor iib [Cyclospora cayetanensis]|uniref:General transcription factor TFIIB n=1 Tax=Cyclospora cayetanensis TaxID=88456 RepID=A0A1D3DAP5_9EIME|nr:transcription initiation factor iib [Cyclospora cayetanensis]
MQPPSKLQRTGSIGGASGPPATTSVSFSVSPIPGVITAAPPVRLDSTSSVNSSSGDGTASVPAGLWNVSSLGASSSGVRGVPAASGVPAGISPGAPSAGAAASRRRFNLYASSKRNLCCPFCTPSGGSGSTIVLDSSSGDQLCRDCGYVLEERVLNEEQEWRSFSAETSGGAPKGADRNRVGEALDGWLEDGGIGTSMLIGGGSSSKGLGSGRRLQMLHEAATGGSGAGESGSRDRQLRAAFSYLRLIGEAFSFRDHVLERAKEIAKELLDAGHLRSRSTAVSMLAITYLACREAGATRTVRELVVYDRSISEKELGKAINRIKRQLPMRGGTNNAETATHLLPRYCSRLQLSMHISDVAEYVAKRATQIFVCSHRPNSVAAAAIWLVVQLLSSSSNPQQPLLLPKASEIASVTGAGEHTLRTICKDMLDVAEHLLPSEFQPTIEGGIEALRARTGRKRKAAAP